MPGGRGREPERGDAEPCWWGARIMGGQGGWSRGHVGTLGTFLSILL